jgi:hypothetical protein
MGGVRRTVDAGSADVAWKHPAKGTLPSPISYFYNHSPAAHLPLFHSSADLRFCPDSTFPAKINTWKVSHPHHSFLPNCSLIA